MDLIAVLDEVFKYKIGDILIHRAGLVVPAEGKSEKTIGQYPFHVRLHVNGRLLDQCEGGVRRFYRLAAVDHNGQVLGESRLCEGELALFPKDRVKKEW